MVMASPVIGFLPALAAFLDLEKVPKPITVTSSPFATVVWMAAITASTTSSVDRFVAPMLSATADINPCLFIYITPFLLWNHQQSKPLTAKCQSLFMGVK